MTSATRTCPSCATTLADDAQFCSRCGTATPTEPGVPMRTAPTGELEVAKVRRALADRYQVERVLGEGGMATVYLAEDLKHRRKVAVKVMRPELAATLGADRFLREVEIARTTEPSAHPADVRLRGGRWVSSTMSCRMSRARRCRRSCTARTSCVSRRRSRSPVKSARRSPTPTSVGSFTATSSPPTSC